MIEVDLLHGLKARAAHVTEGQPLHVTNVFLAHELRQRTSCVHRHRDNRASTHLLHGATQTYSESVIVATTRSARPLTRGPMKADHSQFVKVIELKDRSGRVIGSKEVVTYQGLLAKAHDE